ncbi:MAG: helix-turn-helix transcriptional regulator [Eubacteriales bacterium]|nr:helix-turn-helix transcriptional regulator [Eubacteriales bacterium]
MNKKWRDVEKNITALTNEELAEIELRVQIAGKIIEARQNKDLTQRALEEISGVRQPVIARIEKGKTDPQITTVLRMLKPLGYTLAVVPLTKSKEDEQ